MNEFNKARIKLAIWYIFISLVMLTIFSVAAISAEKRSFSKIQNALGNRIQRPHLTLLLEQRINNFESDFMYRLLFFDVILLGLSTGASWFLSGKTLKPIQIMVNNQEEFAADISHELRTPLTTVNMEIESIKRTTSHIPITYLTVFTSIQEEVKRMTTLVEGLLTMVRTNKKQGVYGTVNVSTIAKEISGKLSLLAKEKGIKFIFEIETTILVKGDTDELKRLFTIFIDNAIRYTPTGGKINIRLQKTKNTAVVTITDTGIGITEEDISHIFERFYRTRSPHITDSGSDYKGTGLGLSIAKHILKEHSGTVKVISKYGKGTTFIIYFPLIS